MPAAGSDEDLLVGREPSGSRRRTAVVVGAAVALIAALLGLRLAGDHHDAERSRGVPPVPAPAPATAGRTAASPGAVFIAHLAQCTVTDHRHTLTVAFGVTNLAARPVRLVDAGAQVLGGTLELAHVGIGGHPCAAGAGHHPVLLSSAASAVVTMSFRLGLGCPHDAQVQARMTFRQARQELHAESSQLADLSRISFVQCPRPG